MQNMKRSSFITLSKFSFSYNIKRVFTPLKKTMVKISKHNFYRYPRHNSFMCFRNSVPCLLHIFSIPLKEIESFRFPQSTKSQLVHLNKEGYSQQDNFFL